MADSYTVRTWNSQGLPRDAISTENGILVTRAGRWPLTIDPQEQVSMLKLVFTVVYNNGIHASESPMVMKIVWL